jgi:hypothetical protein
VEDGQGKKNNRGGGRCSEPRAVTDERGENTHWEDSQKMKVGGLPLMTRGAARGYFAFLRQEGLHERKFRLLKVIDKKGRVYLTSLLQESLLERKFRLQ